MIASIVYAADGSAIEWWILSVLWLALTGLLAFLMVSTWRYPSFKDLALTRPRSPLSIILVAGLIYIIWTFLTTHAARHVRRIRWKRHCDPRGRNHSTALQTHAARAGASSWLSTERPLVAVVGGDTLLAREIRDLLRDAKPSPRIELISAAADDSTILAREEDEAVVMIPLIARKPGSVSRRVSGRFACIQPPCFEVESRRTAPC